MCVCHAIICCVGVIHFLPDPHIEGAARPVVGRMRLALMLGQRENFGVPGVGAHARRIM